MGKPKPPEPALLFVGTLYSDENYFARAKETLTESFGAILIETPKFNWDYSDYYIDELGWPIKKSFLFFKELINPKALTDIKLKTNSIEETLSSGGKRKINLDPGYLTLSKVVLASTKDYSHRIYLGEGIYAEITLMYMNGRFQPHLFTYRDYKDEKCIRIFAEARRLLRH